MTKIKNYKKNSVSLFKNYGLIYALKNKFGKYIIILDVSRNNLYPFGNINWVGCLRNVDVTFLIC